MVEALGALPVKLFIDDIPREAKLTFLVMYKHKVLNNAAGILNENEKIEFKKGLKEFPFPKIPYIDYENEIIDIEDLFVYAYLCYVAYQCKSHIIKIDINMIHKRTKLGKQKIKEILNKLATFKTYITPLKNGKVELDFLSPKLLDELKLAGELHDEYLVKVENGELEESETTPIPLVLTNNPHKFGLTFAELGLVVTFIMYAYDCNYTFEECIVKTMERIKDEPITEFRLRNIIKQLEKEDLFKLVVLSNGNVQLIYPETV